jgi:hypothetical protein
MQTQQYSLKLITQGFFFKECSDIYRYYRAECTKISFRSFETELFKLMKDCLLKIVFLCNV